MNVNFKNGKFFIEETNYIPLGTIMPFASNITSPPLGWLLCDGSTISRTTYSDLFSILGTQWGEGDGSTTFHLPDLRGRFIRGRDRGQGNDLYANDRVAINFGGAIGDNVGSYFQHTTALSSITAMSGSGTFYGNSYGGYYSGNPADGWIGDGQHKHRKTDDNFGVGGVIAAHDEQAIGTTEWGGYHGHNFVVSGSVSISGGDDETAPKNCYVEYLIKYGE